MSKTEQQQRKELVGAYRKLAEKGLMDLSTGNISWRFGREPDTQARRKCRRMPVSKWFIGLVQLQYGSQE